MEEFRSDPDYPVPWFVDDVDTQALVDPEAFGRYVARVLGERALVDGRSRFVPMTTLWWVDGERLLGKAGDSAQADPGAGEGWWPYRL